MQDTPRNVRVCEKHSGAQLNKDLQDFEPSGCHDNSNTTTTFLFRPCDMPSNLATDRKQSMTLDCKNLSKHQTCKGDAPSLPELLIAVVPALACLLAKAAPGVDVNGLAAVLTTGSTMLSQHSC